MKIPGIGSFGERTARAVPSVFTVMTKPPETPLGVCVSCGWPSSKGKTLCGICAELAGRFPDAPHLTSATEWSLPPDWAQIYARMDRK